MRTTLKKLLSLAVCVAMVVSIFAACGKSPENDNDIPDETDYIATSGVIVLTTGAVFSIRYDTQGNVDSIFGNNDLGLSIAEAYDDYNGKTVTDVIKQLINLSAENKALTEDISTILMNITSAAVFSSEEACSQLVTAAQEALTEAGSVAVPMVIDEDNLTGEGYLTLATVKTLIMNKLGVEKFDAFYGDTLPTNNYYVVTVELDGVQTSYTVDAYYGFISIATQEDLVGDAENTEFDSEHQDDNIPEDSLDEEPVVEQDGDIDIPID